MDDCDSCENCGCCDSKEIDSSKLTKEGKILLELFDKVNEDLISALKGRKEIIEKLQKTSDKTRTEYDEILRSRHPVLIQFVLGNEK